MSKRDERRSEEIAHEAARWIAREAGHQSLITVTRAALAARGERATVFVSVFPAEESRAALVFLVRKQGEFRDHLAQNARIRPLPQIEFALEPAIA